MLDTDKSITSDKTHKISKIASLIHHSFHDSLHVTNTSFLTHKVRRNRVCKTYNYWGYFCAAIYSLPFPSFSALITSFFLFIIQYSTKDNWCQPISMLGDDSFAFKSLKILGPYQQKRSLLLHAGLWARSGDMVANKTCFCPSGLPLKTETLDYQRDLCVDAK